MELLLIAIIIASTMGILIIERADKQFDKKEEDDFI